MYTVSLSAHDNFLRHRWWPTGLKYDARDSLLRLATSPLRCAVWVSTGGFSVARVADGGKVPATSRTRGESAPFALMLGGLHRRTMFICTAEWQVDGVPANLERLATGPSTGEILALPVEVPGTGRP